MSAELAVVEPVGAITHQDTDSWTGVVAEVVRLAEHVATTDFVPRGLRGNVPAISAAILYGREVGFPPMTALQQVYVIEGRPALYAEAMRALILAAGHEIRFEKTTGAECVVRGRRRGQADWSEPVVWNRDMAQAAGLVNRDQWKKWPRSMLIARASTDLARMMFADVIHGFRSVEEAGDGSEEPPELEVEPPKRTRVARRPRKTAKTAAGETPAPTSPAAPDPGPPLPDEDDIDKIGAERIDQAGWPVAPPLPVEEMPRDQDPRPRARQPHYTDDDDPLPEELQPHGTGRPKRPLDAQESIVRDIVLHFGRMGLGDPGDRAERLMLTGRIVGRDVETTNELTPDEASYVLATIRVVKNLGDLRRILDVVEDVANPPEETP